MRRASKITSILALLTGFLPALLAPLAAGAAAERGVEGSVVVLATRGNERGIGAGTVIEEAGTHVRVLTAAHVATFGVLQLRVGDGTVEPAQLVAVIAGRDLAVIDAEVTADIAAGLAAAPLGRPQAAESVHVWGSGNDGPAYETATVTSVGRDLPDGAPHGRYALGCALCHEGDSGAGVFNARGQLVGVYIGYFALGSRRVSVAELPASAVEIAAIAPKPHTTAISVSGHGMQVATASLPQVSEPQK